MAGRTCRVGIHGRNNVTFEELDYEVMRTARFEAIKMMGQTSPDVFKRLKKENSNLEIITRLYDDRIGLDKHPSPQEFAEKQIPLMRALQAYCLKFEVHNEPNHLHRYEGWGQEDHHAQDFNKWYLQVYKLLKKACPWALLGFPGLAIPHRDLEWIEICRPAIERSDWLGVHCYWQTPAGQERNHLADFWGLRFKYYYEKFPNKIQEITECGNSNIQADPPIAISEDVLAQQFVEYFQECFKYPYINSACFFMLSSQDPTWDFFSWRSENGRVKPVVEKVGQMNRPALQSPQVISKPIDTTSTFTPSFGGVTNGINVNVAGVQVNNITLRLPKDTGSAYPQRPLSNIQRIIIHHTAVSEKVGPERIAKLQVKNGKPGISYHYFIAEDGTVYQTNELTTVSQHTQGYDQNGVAIAFAGNFTSAVPTQQQLAAGGNLCAGLLSQLKLSKNNISGATELIATQSPGQQWLKGKIWKNLLFNKINQADSGPNVLVPPITTPTTPTDTGQVNQLKAQVAQLQAQLNQAQALNAQLQTQLKQNASAAGSNAQDQATITSLTSQVSQLQAQLTQAQTLNGQLQVQLAQAQSGSGGGSVPGPVAPPTIKNIINTLPKSSSQSFPTRPPSAIDTLIVHHTAIKPQIDIARIAKVHIDRGAAGITYHFYVDVDGTVYQTNEPTSVTPHTQNYAQRAIAVAFAGNFTDAIPGATQLQNGARLIAWLQGQFNITGANVKGAGEVMNTQSPGKQWLEGQQWKNKLMTQAQSLGGSVTPSTGSGSTADAGEMAELKERIAELELQLSFAREAAVSVGGSGPTSVSRPTVPPPVIDNIINSLAQHPTERYPSRSTSAIKSVVIHHSAIPATISAERIAKFNVEKNSWPGIGFHYFITVDGTIQQTQELTTSSFHAGGDNPTSIGIALAGDYNDAPPPEAQIQASGHLTAWLLSTLNLSTAAVRGHNEFADTPCPGRQWDSGANWKESLFGVVDGYLGGSGGVVSGSSGSSRNTAQQIYHYMLFSQASPNDMSAAGTYISAFQPQVGFSVNEAMSAQFVTIVGGTQGISSADEARLKAGGAKVERIGGNSPQATKALLDNMAMTNRRFLRL